MACAHGQPFRCRHCDGFEPARPCEEFPECGGEDEQCQAYDEFERGRLQEAIGAGTAVWVCTFGSIRQAHEAQWTAFIVCDEGCSICSPETLAGEDKSGAAWYLCPHGKVHH